MNKRIFCNLFLLTLILASVFFLSCSPAVRDINPEEDKAEDSNFSSADLRDISQHMSDSLKGSAFISNFQNEKPLLVIAQNLKNNTDEHIETRTILQKIRTKMINDGVARFIDDAAMNQALENLNAYNSDLFDDTMVVSLGKFLKVKYLIRGDITNIRKKDRNVNINFYNVTLTCVDMETLEIKWTDEKELKRITQKGKMRY